MGIPIEPSLERQTLLQEAIQFLCESSAPSTGTYKVTPEEDDEAFEESFEMADLVTRVDSILNGASISGGGRDELSSSTTRTSSSLSLLSEAHLNELDACFTDCNQKHVNQDKQQEFDFVERFVLTEQNNTRSRSKAARELEASEEKRLAIEVAKLKGLRLISQQQNHEEELRWKISDAERSFVSRKVVYADATRLAGNELRVQFAGVRQFLEELHRKRKEALLKEHRRTVVYQALMHSLQGTDQRVVALIRQIAMRLYRKKEYDLNEFHLQQTLEEAVYLESMMNALDKVQASKEKAARELFDLHVHHMQIERANNVRRDDELALFTASGTLEMAKIVAQYTSEDAEDQERKTKIQQRVEAMDRTRNFTDPTLGIMSVSKIYDTIIWSVANTDLCLTSTTGSSLFSSEFGEEEKAGREDQKDDEENEFGEEEKAGREDRKDDKEDYENPKALDVDDQEDHEHQQKCMTPIGMMYKKKLAKELKNSERAIVQKHRREVRVERRNFLKASRDLKAKHQDIIEQLVESVLIERQNLREAIAERMMTMVRRQEVRMEQMRRKDLRLMKDALAAEDQRVEEIEASFMKAQELISAQVFHEVRNALSSVIAMSEITHSMKQDVSMTANDLVRSVDDMLDQIGDVVNYALKMLNEILDLSKINSGAFIPQNEACDLNDIVSRATRMQQAKASRINMSFCPSERPMIAVSDSGIVERMVATLISNAVKFTPNGAVQTFVWPLDAITNGESEPTEQGWGVSVLPVSSFSVVLTSTTISESNRNEDIQGLTQSETGHVSDNLAPLSSKMKMVAVGVADTGIGLTEKALNSAKFVISTSMSKTTQHGAQNTGFGLYHAHLQARALNTQLRLANIDDCRGMLNKTFLQARKAYELKELSGTGIQSSNVPGRGTILYFTLPVYEDGDSADNALQACIEEPSFEATKSAMEGKYMFRPLPSPDSKTGCFRILVADDVIMLRKGMVHTISKLWTECFPACPVCISTACSAEDVLRAAAAEPFDLIVCDHLFNDDLAKLRKISQEDRAAGGTGRPQIRFNTDSDDSLEIVRTSIKNFFAEERFTIEENDGTLLGLNALIQLIESSHSTFPIPILMLVSGHKLDAKDELGIIVKQKPLKSSEFVSSLETHALRLLRFGRCRQSTICGSADPSSPEIHTLVNVHGSQMLVLVEGQSGANIGMEQKWQRERR